MPSVSLPGEPSFLVRFAAACALAAAVLSTYAWIGVHGPARLPPPSTGLDGAIPLLPVTSWLYLPGYVLAFVAAVALVPTRREFRAAIEAFVLVSTLAFFSFVFYPVASPPRPLLPGELGGLSGWMMRWLYGLDPEANSFPSLHVSNAVICGGVVAAKEPRLRGPAWALAVAIALSTLTTRQHWIADVVSGAVLGLLGIATWERRRCVATAVASAEQRPA
jgi:membrane-associated phospholipid phosphatase